MTDVTPAPEDRLSINVDDADPATFVLDGDLDPLTAPMLQERVDDVDDDVTRVVFDVRAVGFADSAGLRVIADTHRRLHDAGGTLVIREPSNALRKLLTVTGLADHVSVEPS